MESKDKKKILFLITKSNWGGAQRYVFDLTTSLDSPLYEPVVALGGEGSLINKLEEAGIKTVSIPGLTRDISFMQEIKAALSIISIIRKEKPAVLHVNSSKAGFIGTMLGRLLRVKSIVFTSHGWAFNEDRPLWEKTFFKVIHWLTVLLSHRTITVSNAVKSQMDWPLVQNKMTVINPGRFVPTFMPKNEARGILETKITDSTANLSDYHKDIWVGTIAELHPIKQLNRAIDSIASVSRDIPNLRYVIIGDGQLKKELQLQVANLGIEKHVFFAGSIHEAARLLRAFDIFILPSASEAYGYVLIEAGLAHVPVIATDVGGVTDILTDNHTGLLVPPHDTLALSNALKTLITDTQMREKFANALYTQMKTRTVEKMVQDTARIY